MTMYFASVMTVYVSSEDAARVVLHGAGLPGDAGPAVGQR
jgi:hypothetical protein